GPVKSETIPLPGLDTQHQYSLLYSLSSLSRLAPASAVTVEVVQGGKVLASKTLHSGDAEFYTQFRVPVAGDAAIRITNKDAAGDYSLHVNRWPLSSAVRSGPVYRWQDAMPIQLGTTVFASGDHISYIPLPGTHRSAVAEDARRTDWYRFEF